MLVVKMAFILLLLLTFVATTTASLPYHSKTVIGQFKEFVIKHDRNYENEIEEAFRFGIFLKNLDFIDHLNKHNNGATFGITKFADMTGKEIRKSNTGSIKQDHKRYCTIKSAVGGINETYPDRFDWRTKGVVTPVKDQGQCGSSWAFSTVGNLESVHAIKSGNLVELSAQQLVDCDASGYGCNGGYLTSAFAYLKENGSMYESYYPYVGYSQPCRYDSIKARVRMNDCYALNEDEDMYSHYLREWGPLSILVDSTVLPSYTGGIILYEGCESVDVDHGALIVGYDIDEFWIIKNSWGQDWGEQGYFRVRKGVNCLSLANNPPVSAYIF